MYTGQRGCRSDTGMPRIKGCWPTPSGYCKRKAPDRRQAEARCARAGAAEPAAGAGVRGGGRGGGGARGGRDAAPAAGRRQGGARGRDARGRRCAGALPVGGIEGGIQPLHAGLGLDHLHALFRRAEHLNYMLCARKDPGLWLQHVAACVASPSARRRARGPLRRRAWPPRWRRRQRTTSRCGCRRPRAPGTCAPAAQLAAACAAAGCPAGPARGVAARPPSARSCWGCAAVAHAWVTALPFDPLAVHMAAA
jgi:hypothetical protein